jgi:hypothetical protein
VTFTWSTSNPSNINPNSLSLLDLTGGPTLASGLANDGSEPIVMGGPITKVTATSHSFRITGVNTQSGGFNRDLTFSWRWRMFYGVSANVTLTEAQIEALAGTQLATGIAGTYSTGAGGYKYICTVHAMGGQINSVKDQLTGFDAPMATAADNAAYSNVDGGGFSYALVAGTNAFGVAVQYRVYRTKNFLGGAVTLVVA